MSLQMCLYIQAIYFETLHSVKKFGRLKQTNDITFVFGDTLGT